MTKSHEICSSAYSSDSYNILDILFLKFVFLALTKNKIKGKESYFQLAWAENSSESPPSRW